MRPETSHKLRNEDTAIFLVSPDAFIHMSIRDGPLKERREQGEEVSTHVLLDVMDREFR